MEFVQRDSVLSEAQRLIHTRGRGSAVFSCQTSTYVDAVLLLAPGSLPQHTAGELYTGSKALVLVCSYLDVRFNFRDINGFPKLGPQNPY